jgi:hypothetical protein
MKNSIDFEELKKLVEEVAQPIAPLPSSELSQLTALIAQCFTY